MWMRKRLRSISGERWEWWCVENEERRAAYIGSTGCCGASSMTMVVMALLAFNGVGEGMARFRWSGRSSPAS